MGHSAFEFVNQHILKDRLKGRVITINLRKKGANCMDHLLQFYVNCSQDRRRKYPMLVKLLENTTTIKKILIYSSSKNDANSVHKNLQRDGYKETLLDCNSTVAVRLEAIRAFNSSSSSSHAHRQTILIINYPTCHGIGLKNVRLVINYELFSWRDSEQRCHQDYLHKACKCYQTKVGFAVNMVENRDQERVSSLESFFKIRLIQLKLES